MPVNGRKKGQTYERKIAETLGEAFDMKFKRTPMSGGWSKETIQGDIVPIGDHVFFGLSVECKNYKTFPKQVLLWLLQSINDTKGTNKSPVVVFHIGQTNNKNVYKLNQTTTITNPFPRGEDFVIMRLNDYLNIIDKDVVKDEAKWNAATQKRESKESQCSRPSKKAKSSSSIPSGKKSKNGKSSLPKNRKKAGK